MNTPTPRIRPETVPDAATALALIDRGHQAVIDAEITELIGIAAAADHYQIDDAAMMSGIGDLVEPGHDGTPQVSEWLSLEIAGLLEISPVAAGIRVSQTLDLRFRFPKLWEQVLAGQVRVWHAMKVVAATIELSCEAAARVDACAALAMPGQAFSVTMRQLPSWITHADPDHATQRATAMTQRRRVSVTRIEDGQIGIFGLVDPADGIAFDHALNQIAATLDMNRDQGRAAALGILARQALGHDTLPTHTLVVHLDPDSPHVTDVDEWGPILTQELPVFLKDSKVTVRPIIDTRTLPPTDRHDPTPTMRFAIEQRDHHDRFPWGTLPANKCDLDHTQPYQQGGTAQTRPDNLEPLSRKTHRAKTHAGWNLTQPAPGVFHWTSPAGYQYQVDHHGTRRIRPDSRTTVEPARDIGQTPAPRPPREAVTS